VVSQGEPGGAVIWKACRAGAGSLRGEAHGGPVDAAVSRQAGAVPVGPDSSHSTWSWNLARPDEP
jgi:hypothetical protein